MTARGRNNRLRAGPFARAAPTRAVGRPAGLRASRPASSLEERQYPYTPWAKPTREGYAPPRPPRPPAFASPRLSASRATIRGLALSVVLVWGDTGPYHPAQAGASRSSTTPWASPTWEGSAPPDPLARLRSLRPRCPLAALPSGDSFSPSSFCTPPFFFFLDRRLRSRRVAPRPGRRGRGARSAGVRALGGPAVGGSARRLVVGACGRLVGARPGRRGFVRGRIGSSWLLPPFPLVGWA